MTPLKQDLIRRSIKRFFYKVRFNIGVHTAVSKEEFGVFKSKVEAALSEQMLFFAKIEKVNKIVGVVKAVGVLTEMDLIKELLLIWVPLGDFIDRAEFQAYHLKMANQGGQIAMDKIGAKGAFKIEDEKLLGSIKRKARKTMRIMDGTTKSWIARTIEEGLLRGDSHIEIAKLLRDGARQQAKMRAELVAENEATLLIGEIEETFYKQNNISQHRWITARDEIVCPSCLANEEAGLIPVGEVFPGGTTTTPDHYRCRCFLEPIIPNNFNLLWAGK